MHNNINYHWWKSSAGCPISSSSLLEINLYLNIWHPQYLQQVLRRIFSFSNLPGRVRNVPYLLLFVFNCKVIYGGAADMERLWFLWALEAENIKKLPIGNLQYSLLCRCYFAICVAFSILWILTRSVGYGFKFSFVVMALLETSYSLRLCPFVEVLCSFSHSHEIFGIRTILCPFLSLCTKFAGTKVEVDEMSTVFKAWRRQHAELLSHL